MLAIYINEKLLDYDYKLFDLFLTISSLTISMVITEMHILKFPEQFVFSLE